MTVQRSCSHDLQVRETIRDVAILHNEQFFAAAQKKYVYIYDKRGLEVHCLKVRRHVLYCQNLCSACPGRLLGGLRIHR